ncbi:glycosyltransferase [Aeromicrobium sp.]|uniref:glycosyltransferase family 2 protein n=1 Tax=Aeromicrobium sp. TaxID=1871063 RepID=UPI001982FEBD|nr:glycosyltransferase [Aeromicrobium sp.]MBC7632317.1 glycosyltransferase [Aeromicrobium sp.]
MAKSDTAGASVTGCSSEGVGGIHASGEFTGTLTIAVLTYKRNVDLEALLPALVAQMASARAQVATARVLVIDNDPAASARSVLESQPVGLPVDYVHEPVPGISSARNRALAASADSDLLVFIDDDERPTEGWLGHLLATYEAADRPAAVIGPVISTFAVEPDAWVASGDFFSRRRMPTGTAVNVGATNNLLLDLRQVRELELTFDTGFGTTGGEDTLFTMQVVAGGRRMVWCDEAIVHDVVPAARVTRSWVLGRALSSGNSWSLISVRLAGGLRARSSRRLLLSGRGLLRLGGGSARWMLGVVSRSSRHRAKGLRTAARGLGMVSGAWGYRYEEYRRTA